MLPGQFKMKVSSNFSDEKAMEGCCSLGIKRDPSGAAEVSKSRKSVSFSETTPKLHSNDKIEKQSSGTKNFSKRVQLHELEMAIEEARFEISRHFENMEMQVDNNYKDKVKEVETWTQRCLTDIESRETPPNDFFIQSLIDNFEEVIRKIEYESKMVVNHSMDDIRKVVVKLVKRIDQSFTPKPFINDIKVTRRYIAIYVWVMLWSLAGIVIWIYPDYVLNTFDIIIATQLAVLILILFYILYYHSSVFK